MGDGTWKQVRTDWRDVVLVCRKCSKKLDGGFGPDGEDRFAKALRDAVDGPGKLKARRRTLAVVEVGCFGLCPRRAVVVVKGSDPGPMLLVPKGAAMGEVVERLALRTGVMGAPAGPREREAPETPPGPASA